MPTPSAVHHLLTRCGSALHFISSLRFRTKAILFTLLVLGSGFTVGFVRLSRHIDARLANAGEGGGLMLYSSPTVVAPGDEATAESLVSHLRSAGYSTDVTNPIGSYALEQDAVRVKPGRDSYFRDDAVRIRFADGKVAGLTGASGQAVDDYALEPEPLVRIEDGNLEKRRPVRFEGIPQVLTDALLAAEDKHFFHHAGFDPLRIVKAAWSNYRSGRKVQGGSTLTMQLARNLYLESNKTWKRKLEEFAIAEMLEIKLTKKEIFENYVNQVYLGRRNTMALHGFGQAAATYFGKDLARVNLQEAALLAGLVQRPSYFDPIRHPERAIARRNLVLTLMAQSGSLSERERDAAIGAPLQLAPRTAGASDAPWFLDLAVDELQSREGFPAGGRVYTTIDMALQRAAVDSIRAALPEIDRRAAAHGGDQLPQVALIALDPHTGEVKALVGGRDFAGSQVNHATSLRQPGSVFKPFVYAAALSSGRGLTAASTVLDEPTTFPFEGQQYRPTNFGDHFHGQVTLRRALAESMNVAAVSVAGQVGYKRVLDMARAAGINEGMRPTPALALGAYEATPLEMAGAYTVFANGGQYVQPIFVSEVRTGGKATYTSQPQRRQVLEPSAAFVMQDMLVEVLRTGTAAGVRARGFRVPAAGKTGTSRDGWFAGFVSNLVCVVWVGFDNNDDLDIEGAKSALPVWTEFMKRASERETYRQELPSAPAGVRAVTIDAGTGRIAGPSCTNTRREFFLHGTEPSAICTHEAPQDDSNSSFRTIAFDKEAQ